MNVKSVPNNEYGEITTVSIAIGRPRRRKNQQHIGFLHFDGKDVKFLHLASHYDLRNDDPNDKYLWLDIPLDNANKKHIAAICALIYEENQNGIPYGICIDGTGFSKVDGAFTADEPYAGLTCATFVIQVLHSQGILIIDFDKWKHVPDDKIWQNQILQKLEKLLSENVLSKEHLKYQRKKIKEGSARFRPEQVAVAAHLPKRPHGPAILKEPAKELLELIVEHSKNI